MDDLSFAASVVKDASASLHTVGPPQEATFTPGPWRVSADDIDVGPEGAFSVIGGCGCCNSPWVLGDNPTANAQLIAAAPELLESLNDFLNNPLFQVGVGGNPIAVEAMLAKARAAVAKATQAPQAGADAESSTIGENQNT